MKKIVNRKELRSLKNYPREVRAIILEVISILNENYGTDRKVDIDLGGYVLIVENLEEIKTLKKEKLKGLVAEYIDVIKCSCGINWVSILFLLSSDFSIVVVTTEELSKFLLK